MLQYRMTRKDMHRALRAGRIPFSSTESKYTLALRLADNLHLVPDSILSHMPSMPPLGVPAARARSTRPTAAPSFPIPVLTADPLAHLGNKATEMLDESRSLGAVAERVEGMYMAVRAMQQGLAKEMDKTALKRADAMVGCV